MFPNTSSKFAGKPPCQNLQAAHTEVCALNYMRTISRQKSEPLRKCHTVRFLGLDFLVSYGDADAVDQSAMEAALLEQKVLPPEAQVRQHFHL